MAAASSKRHFARDAAVATLCLILQVFKAHSLGLNPIVDYVLPVWPSINCFNPTETDNSQVAPSDSFQAYLSAVEQESARHPTSGLFFTAQCKQSLMLHGIIECYYVFDKTAYRTGLNTLKNVQPYPGLSLNFCALQLDNGPVKTSDICFDNSGIDPNHPYVIAKVETRGPQYNIFQTYFGVSVHDSNVSPPQDYTIAYQCYFL